MEQVILELARFLDISFEEAKKRVEEYNVGIAGEAWNKASPKVKEDVDQFYRDVDHYLYELIPWNYASPVFHQRIEPLLFYHNKKILELGAGIGSLCIALAYAGNQVTYCDINDKLCQFAKQRFEDRNFAIPIVQDLRTVKDFEIVVAIDFFEHIHPDGLLSLLKEIASILKDGGFLYHRSNFGQQDIFPMHYDHSGYFNKLAKEAGLNLRGNGDLVKGGEARGVQIGIPIIGDMSDLVFYGFLGLQKPPGTKLTKIRGKPADMARNIIIKALEKDWLFFMDSDQTFHPDTLMRLLSWDLPIVSGLYFKSPGKPVPHAYKYAWKEKEHLYIGLVDEVFRFLSRYKDKLRGDPPAIILPAQREDLLECDGVGAGCLLVHRRVFEAIEPPWFKYSGDTALGEDFDFCRKAQEAGFKIYIDPGVVCGHQEKGLVGHQQFLNWVSTAGKETEFPYPWGES